MILQSLYELYSRLADDPDYKISPSGFSPQKISFRVVLREDGSLHDIEDARVPNDIGKLINFMMDVPGDAKPSGAGINPCFLWDNQTYLLGRQPEDKKMGFGLERFETFRNTHLSHEMEINHPHYSSVCRFLEQWNPDRIHDFPRLNELNTGFGIFQILGEKRCVHQLSAVIDWWNSKMESQDYSGTRLQCLISGKPEPIARLHPKIKGITDAQSSGASLVSFNETAYESYRKTQSFNSPVGEDAAFRYGTALNSLLNGPMCRRHRLRVGDATTVFWTDLPSEAENCFAQFLSEGSNAIEESQDEIVRSRLYRFLKAVRSGNAFEEFGPEAKTGFSILGLSPNAARLAVRFFHRSSIENLLEHLHSHQKCIQIIKEVNEINGKRLPDPEFPPVWQILKETARSSDDIPPLISGALTRSIVQGIQYPEALFSAILRRIRADRTINYIRAAMIKATLVRNHQIHISVMLDKNSKETAYRLGRLFSALEKTQEDALGFLNAGIRDRFYGAASATPASVFPRLLRTYQHHLSKMDPKYKIYREQLIQEIMDEITSFPSQLNLQRQGLFAIGYYHQRRDFFTKKEKPLDITSEN